MHAIIRFIPFERGGRRTPVAYPDGYSTPARFESDPETKLGYWSIRLRDVTKLRGDECIKADVQFLFPDAPAELMKEGERFEMMEGSRVVAKGVFLPEKLQIPSSVSDFELALLG